MQHRHQIGAVVHGQVRLVGDGRLDVLVVGAVLAGRILALDGVGRDAVLGHQRRRHIVLGGERVAGAEHQVRPAGLERDRQVGGLGGDVQAAGHPEPLQRLLLLEPLADQPSTGISMPAYSTLSLPLAARLRSLTSCLTLSHRYRIPFVCSQFVLGRRVRRRSWRLRCHPTSSRCTRARRLPFRVA